MSCVDQVPSAMLVRNIEVTDANAAFFDAANAFHNGKDSDNSVNDATYNVVYVDSHDYGPNNSDRTAKGKEDSLRTFREHWANGAYGQADDPGVPVDGEYSSTRESKVSWLPKKASPQMPHASFDAPSLCSTFAASVGSRPVATSSSTRVVRTPANRRALVAACIGNAVEWYDFAIYGAFSTILAATFFPTAGPAALAATFAIFATSFIARPIGAALVAAPAFAAEKVAFKQLDRLKVMQPSSAEYWHIGETTMRLRMRTSRSLISSNSISSASLPCRRPG